MPRKDVLDAIRKYTDPFRVTKGKDFRLRDFNPGDTRGLKMDKQEAAEPGCWRRDPGSCRSPAPPSCTGSKSSARRTSN
ncbi:MAG TPA: hypothetical protein VFE60_11085 [Roseiarcus sp.]|jgi:hypothetical protein|nr:hypothetical protein [Roseiarcus sp.]